MSKPALSTEFSMASTASLDWALHGPTSPFATAHIPQFASSRRSPVVSLHGAVASSQPLASEIGLSILKRGGNCVDAAVAIAAALNVTEPCSTGIGGDCFCLYFNARTGKVQGLNASGRAPMALSIEKALKDTGVLSQFVSSPPSAGPAAAAESKSLPQSPLNPLTVAASGGDLGGVHDTLSRLSESQLESLSLPDFHIHAATVPGAAAGWVDAVEKWGTMKLADILAPAIDLAENGYPVSPLTAFYWRVVAPHLHKTAEQVKAALEATSPAVAEAAKTRASQLAASNQPPLVAFCPFLHQGQGPAAGDVFRNPDLAKTFHSLAQHGKDGFYKGPIAQSIVDTVQALGGCMTLEDLAAHHSTFPEPIHVNYRGVDVWEIPPNGQGLTALLALNILEGFNISELKHNSAAYLHHLIEALRIAFADTRWYIADMDKTSVPVDGLLSKSYAAERRKIFNPNRATLDTKRGSPATQSNTVSFCVVDANGDACSFINSNYMNFGTGYVPFGCGFTLQNRGANFSLRPGHPNALAGGKRPYHTIIPGMATKDGALYCPFSVMGGFMQPQGHVQVLCNMIDFKMDPQTALDSLRFCITDGRAGGTVGIEEGIPEEVVAELRAMGHNIEVISNLRRALFGRGQIIRKLPNGTLWSGSDGRCDGCAIGF